MKSKLTALLIIKPFLILALVLTFKPSPEVSTENKLSEEVQSMRGYFLEDQSMKIIVTHKRLQVLKNKILSADRMNLKKHKSNFIKMVKNFNLAINEFERLTNYNSTSWNKSRVRFISIMKKVESQQMNLHHGLSNRKVVSI